MVAAASAELAASLARPDTTILDLPRGIHHDVPEGAYHARILGLASKHALDLVLKAPAAYRAWIDGHDEPPTPAMQFGKDFHAACLEPRKYKPATSTKKGREDAETIAAMVKAVFAHPVASSLLQRGRAEVTARWCDPGTGIECKARADLYCPELRTIVDLKSTGDASAEEFSKSVARFGYHAQAAMYLDGFSLVGPRCDTFAFIAVEKSPPHLVAVYVLDEAALLMGARRIARGLETLKRCLETDEWPGFPANVQTIALPRWAEEG